MAKLCITISILETFFFLLHFDSLEKDISLKLFFFSEEFSFLLSDINFSVDQTDLQFQILSLV